MLKVRNVFPLEWTLHELQSKQSLTMLFLTLLFNSGRGWTIGSRRFSYWKVWLKFCFNFAYLMFSLLLLINLVPRVSPLHAPGSERGETLVGAGHVFPREKLDPGRGASPASLCRGLLSTPKRGFRFAACSPRETHST